MTSFKSVLERTARTFVQGFLGVVTLTSLTTADANIQQALLGGALAGGYAVLMAFAFPPRES